ncbi:hypothetical protein P0F65_16230 [Sphingomonas sp. I4]
MATRCPAGPGHVRSRHPSLAQRPASPAMDRPVPVTLRPAIDRPSTVFEGWGTALAWFAHVTGGWPEAERTRLADLFYGPDGLGWTIARYNIGGGNAADTPPYMKVGRAVPGFWRQPAGVSGRIGGAPTTPPCGTGTRTPTSAGGWMRSPPA